MLRILPRALREKMLASGEFQKIVTNTSWLFMDRIARMGFGVVVGVWVARYLGPTDFGLLNYAQALVALFTALATLGLDRIVVRDLVRAPESKGVILGTTLALRLVGAFLALVASVGIATLSHRNDRQLLVIVSILGSGMLFQALDAIDLWFQAQVQSKRSVIAKNGAFMIMAVVKVGLILKGAPVVAFAWATTAELLLGAVGLLWSYRLKRERISTWRFEFTWARSLMRDGWPMILSGLAIMIYMRIDQVMLGQMLGNQEVGIYSGAVRMSEVWYFIPIAIVSSVMPALVEAKARSDEDYKRKLGKLFRLLMVLSIGLALPMTFLSNHLVLSLYGPAYGEAGPILAIHIWTAIFVFQGVAVGAWTVTENRIKLNLERSIAGAAVNIAFNFLLIPRYGGLGAAVATLMGQAVSCLLINAVRPATRGIFWMEIRAFNVVEWVRNGKAGSRRL